MPNNNQYNEMTIDIKMRQIKRDKNLRQLRYISH